ncbi:MAG: glycosyltransferase family 4 protein [Acuticoccus sp.]
MKVAFITPMKPPTSPVPSGDRTFARLLGAALGHGGHSVSLPSTFSTRCAAPEDFAAIAEAARAETAAVLAALAAEGAPDAVLTYHNYHKAPDLLGPAIAARFAIPYAIVEASRAPRRAAGPWAAPFAAADAALAAADALGAVTRRDRPALTAFAPERVVDFPPFIDTAPFAAAPHDGGGRHIVCAAMMREGRKADSLAVLAEAVAIARRSLPDLRVTVAGDGPARAALTPLFPPGALVGRLGQPALADLFAGGDLFVWPAIDEPFGFTFLEAQAAGLPVVGGAAPGVRDVVDEGGSACLVAERDAAAHADAIVRVLGDPARRAQMAAAARAFAASRDLAAGSRRLDALLAFAADRRAARAGGA